MPELPEVETTVRSLNKTVKGLTVKDIWSSYNSPFHAGKNNIKNRKYFAHFKKQIIEAKITWVERRAKNILLHFNHGLTILIHMKMTGHFLYGEYKSVKISAQGGSASGGKMRMQNDKIKLINGKKGWIPKDKTGSLNDPMNRFIRMVISLSNGKHLAFSDMRRFAKIYFFESKDKNELPDLKDLGPDPLDRNFTEKNFVERLLKKPRGKVKQVMMDQNIISGIGNIYSDEILWASSIHPLSPPSKIPKKNLAKVYKAMRKILRQAIESGGDSMSDFRKLDGQKGGFQNFHKAYKKTGQSCSFPKCTGVINRAKIGGRSAHFCSVHQLLYK